MSKKVDPRVLRSREAIRNALTELSTQIPYPEITVSQVCARAGVDRSTFYQHYRNTREVLEDVEAQYLSGFDWPHALYRGNEEKTLNHLKKHKDTFFLLMDYGKIRQKLLYFSTQYNRNLLHEACIDADETEVTVATIVTVSSTLDAFRYMIEKGKDFDVEKIMEMIHTINEIRFKEMRTPTDSLSP